MSAQKTPQKTSGNRPAPDQPAELGPEDSGALRIGATDQGMVRLILTTRSEVAELDFAPEDAREIAEEILAAASLCDSGGKPGKKK